ncbi:LysR family transcriptional regulator [Rhodalgimonas zhirmunskyi]|uniref:LysR family transcriptional regulator n=1 Tax=Rhodalgimonas zhirmunskyi TaxID=2964767 RepID=A0AAJ1UDJ9_9RHOB|nr:LysR family transcriptional regulator [Rhodoalgimonas zhirmunskyi]MDQ2095893.1 LysR family transcriptional regulator [Rhodoalgimonas zhirmunskyi]
MDGMLKQVDWALVQAFLAVAEAGSLSGAARALGRSQPTLGRQVKALEDQLGLRLFQRHPKGLSLSPGGEGLLSPARAMGDAMGEIALYAAGHEAGAAGTVRITASEMVSHYLLPSILVQLRQEAPEIEIELVASDTTENLLYREADIALRMYEPRQLDLVARRLGEIEIGVFAAKSYLARRGWPAGPDDLSQHDLVGYDRSELILRGMREGGIEMRREDFALRCDGQVIYWELVRAGGGIGFGQVPIAEGDPLIARLELGSPMPTLPLWIAAHREMRHAPRVRRVWEALAEGLAPHFKANRTA